MAKAMLDLYCDSFPVVPSHLTLDLDESFDRGEQELRKFNAHYDDWGFLPIHIFDTSGRLVVSVLREAATPSDPGPGQAGDLRERFPRVQIRLRGDSHYACPEVMTLRSLCDRVQRTRKRGCAAGARRRVSSTSSAWPEPLAWPRGSRRLKPARGRDMPRGRAARVQAPPLQGFPGQVLEVRAPDRVEAGPDGLDTRYIVTNLAGRRGSTSDNTAREGEPAEKLHLASDRTSCTRACANQVRLYGAAYWLLWTFQSLMPKRSPWRQFDTLRNRLIKLVTEVTETADRIRIALAPVFPIKEILTVVSARLARFVT
jgi:hypothetical protein